MAQALRVLLWTAVIVDPGGVLLLTFLAADAVRRRGRAVAGDTTRVPVDT